MAMTPTVPLAPQTPPVRQTYGCFSVRVVGIRQLSPTLRRITLGGEALTTYRRFGLDEYFGLLIPPAGQGVQLIADDSEDPRAAVAALPRRTRPHLRWYTVRGHRPELGELDVDMVTHGDNGRASQWAEGVRVGDEAGFIECGYLYAPPLDAGTQLFTADETALPALGAILESGTITARTRAFIEVPDADDIQDLDTTATLTWVVRQGAAPGHELRASLRAAAPERPDYAWVCGEATSVARIRSHLMREVGVSRNRITYSGYWNCDRPRP